MLEEAKKYDHRELTKKQELFFFHPLRYALKSFYLIIKKMQEGVPCNSHLSEIYHNI